MSDNFYEYNNEENSYISENGSSPKKPKKHTGLKACAFVLCLVAIGGSGYQVYKFMNDNKLEPADTIENEETQEVNREVSDIPLASEKSETVKKKPENPSLIDIASRKDAKYLPDIVDEIMPSVVGISSTFEITETYNSWGWMGMQPETQTQQAVATGTGIVMTEDGYIITNAHVVYDTEYNAKEATDVSVLFNDESEHDAKIIAYDVETDIAVLKIDESDLKPAEFGDSSDLRVGELVIAVGNPLGFELFGSVTSGIVSALNREIKINEKNMTLIQTDAAINSGNSGGPLLNSCGQVIGINSAKMSSSYGSASVEGLGFAIPINEAKKIIDDLINNGYVTGRPQIGITSVDVTEAYANYLNIPMGVYVRDVSSGSAAEMAGIKSGDIIIAIQGEPIKNTEELNEIKNKYKAGDTITLTISRDNTDIDIELTLQDANADKDKENPLERESEAYTN